MCSTFRYFFDSLRWPQVNVIRNPWLHFEDQLIAAFPLSLSSIAGIEEGDLGISLPPLTASPEERVIVYPTYQNLFRVLDSGK